MPPLNARASQLSEAERLFEAAVSCAGDPYRFVLMAYPWGVPGGPLEKHPGPDDWQADCLKHVRDNLSRSKPIRIAIAGGVGPGKSALTAWLNDWALTTCVDTRARVTANTGPQLFATTWPELIKWRKMSLWSSWFVSGSRQIRSADPAHASSWRCDPITWEDSTPEALGGFHNQGKRLFQAIDESSSVPPSVFAAFEQGLSDSDTEIIWIILGNPSRATGKFRECFPGGKQSHLWFHKAIDTRTARMTNKQQIAEWIESYGIDSDFVRVRVLSQFPRAGSTQFISSELVSSAASSARDAYVHLNDPLILGVDVAYEGDDKTVLRERRGLDARSTKPLKFRGLDPWQIAARIAEQHAKKHYDAIFVDNGGIGAAVVSRCRDLKLPVRGINFGGTPDRTADGEGVAYYNKAAEMYGLVKEWLPFGMIDEDPELEADLTGRQYGFAMKEGRDCIQLERKKDMKKRGLSSPDDGDALALTFAEAVAPSDHSQTYVGAGAGVHQSDYDPLAYPS